MKKKKFTSKLQFQKTTIVSLNIASNVKGGALQNVDTQIISTDGYMCLTGACTPSQTDPTTGINNTCPPPTNSDTGFTDFCGMDVTKTGCLDTRKC